MAHATGEPISARLIRVRKTLQTALFLSTVNLALTGFCGFEQFGLHRRASSKRVERETLCFTAL
jgi:hypothetical protein